MSATDSFGAYERLGDNNVVDDDDFIHEPGQRNIKIAGTSWRGFFNAAALLAILGALVTLFAGYPLISWARRGKPWSPAHVNATGQVPDISSLPSLIDPDTPTDQLTRTGFDGHDYELVFSDEFNLDGRSFYPGDDPFWEAVDLWVSQPASPPPASYIYLVSSSTPPHKILSGMTQVSVEPARYSDATTFRFLHLFISAGQVTTRDGHLAIVVEYEESHGLQFKSGMLQTWNKFCFTTGYIEG